MSLIFQLFNLKMDEGIIWEYVDQFNLLVARVALCDPTVDEKILKGFFLTGLTTEFDGWSRYDAYKFRFRHKP